MLGLFLTQKTQGTELTPKHCDWWLMQLSIIEYHEENRLRAWARVAEGDEAAAHLAIDSYFQIQRIQREIEEANRRSFWRWPWRR